MLALRSNSVLYILTLEDIPVILGRYFIVNFNIVKYNFLHHTAIL